MFPTSNITPFSSFNDERNHYRIHRCAFQNQYNSLQFIVLYAIRYNYQSIYIIRFDKPMNQEASEYSKIFKEELDPQGLGIIAKNTFVTFINKQPNPPPLYEINDLFNYVYQQGKINHDEFVTYMTAFKQNYHQVAVFRFAVQKQMDKYKNSYSGSAGPSQILTSSLVFEAVAKNQPHETKKKNLSVSLGKDNANQTKKKAEFNEVLGREISELSVVIKVELLENQEEIRYSLQNLLNEAKALASDMLDPQVSLYIAAINIQVKHANNYLYIFLQVNNPFLNDTVRYIHEAFNAINPSIHFKLGANIESTQLQQFIDQLGTFQLNKMKDLFIRIFLQIDSNSKNAINHILMSQKENMQMNHDQIMSSKFFMLLETVELESKFTNTENLLKDFGLQNLTMPLQQMKNNLEQFQLAETIGGFLPSFPHFYELVKNSNKPENEANQEGQISINLGNFFVRAEFNLNLQALINLL